MDAAARQLGIKAALEHLDDIVERQSEASPEFNRQAFFLGRQRSGDPMGAVGTVVDIVAAAPAGDGVVAQPELAEELGVGGGAPLDVGADGGSGKAGTR